MVSTTLSGSGYTTHYTLENKVLKTVGTCSPTLDYKTKYKVSYSCLTSNEITITQNTCSDYLTIAERLESADPLKKTIIIPWIDKDSEIAVTTNVFTVSNNDEDIDLGAITWTSSNTSKLSFIDDSETIITNHRRSIRFNTLTSTTANPDATYDDPNYITVTVHSSNPIIQDDVMKVIILPKPIESRYFIDVHDSTWGVDNYGPTTYYPSTFRCNYFGREMSTTSFHENMTEEEFNAGYFKALYVAELLEIYRIDRYESDGVSVYKGPYIQKRNTDAQGKINTQCIGGSLKYSWAVVSGAHSDGKDCRIPSYDSSKGEDIKYISVKGTDAEIYYYYQDASASNYGGMSDGDQSEGITLRDIESTDLKIEYVVHEYPLANSKMCTREWFDGVGMTSRTAYTPIKVHTTGESHYATPQIWNGGGIITIPANSKGVDSHPNYDLDYYKYIITDEPVTKYKKMQPVYEVEMTVGQTINYSFYSYELITKTNLITGPDLLSDTSDTDTNLVTVVASEYDRDNNIINISLTAKSNGETKWRIKQDDNNGSIITYVLKIS